MIIPIGHEDATVRRAPWVTLGVMALCLLAHVAILLQRDASRELDESYTAAVEYALEHPYLRVDPQLVPPATLRAMGGRPSTGDVAAEQSRLDELTTSWHTSLERHPLWHWGLVPAQPRVATLFTHMFLHAGWLHLISNMLVLYLSGPFLEDAWGRRLYATFYLLAGLFAGAMYALMEHRLWAPLIGASGAVAGVLGAFLLLRGRSRIRFAIVLFFVGTFTAPAWVMLPLWFVGELLDALAGDLAGAGGGGVAYWAHVWGFLFGVAFAAVVRRAREIEKGPVVVAAERRAAAVRHDPRVAEARKLLDRGLHPRAWALLTEASDRDDPDPEALAALWALAVHLGREADALPAARELLRARVRDGDWEAAAALLDSLVAPLAADTDHAPLLLRTAEGLAPTRADLAAGLLARARARGLSPGLDARAVRLAARLGPTAATPATSGEAAAPASTVTEPHPVDLS
jgi:membrane associated rhomboid family serine protease